VGNLKKKVGGRRKVGGVAVIDMGVLRLAGGKDGGEEKEKGAGVGGGGREVAGGGGEARQ